MFCAELGQAVGAVALLVGCCVAGAVGERGGGFAGERGGLVEDGEQGRGGELEMRFWVVGGLPAVQTGERHAGIGGGRRVGEQLPLPGRVGPEVVGGIESCCGGVAEQSAVQPEHGVGWVLLARSSRMAGAVG